MDNLRIACKQKKQPNKRKDGVEKEQHMLVSHKNACSIDHPLKIKTKKKYLQSSCKYANPLAEPIATLILLGQSIAGVPAL